MTDFQPSRQQSDLADVLELLLDKGVVINADIAVSIGDTQLLGIQVRAAIASFETAAKYGLAFPEGTDTERLAAAVDEPELAEGERPNIPVDAARGVNITPGGPSDRGDRAPSEETNGADDQPHDEQSSTLDEFEDSDETEAESGQGSEAESGQDTEAERIEEDAE